MWLLNLAICSDIMERRFTLRIGNDESQMLEELKLAVGESTDAGAIRFVINHYLELNRRYSALLEENKKNKENLAVEKRKRRDFLAALKGLQDEEV